MSDLDAVAIDLVGTALERGDIARAASLLLPVRETHPEDPAVLLAEASLLAASGDRGGALARLTAITEGTSATALRARVLQAEVHLAGYEDAEALACARSVLGWSAEVSVLASAHGVIGDVALRRGNAELARGAYLLADEQHPSATTALRLSAVELRTGNWGDAYRHADAALRRDRNAPDAYVGYHEAAAAGGLVRLARESFALAAEACRLLSIERPNDARPALASARLALRSGDQAGAQAWIDHALTSQTAGRFIARRLRADLNMRLGRYLEATRDLEAYLSYAPRDVTAARQRALAYELAGERASARSALSVALRLGAIA